MIVVAFRVLFEKIGAILFLNWPYGAFTNVYFCVLCIVYLSFVPFFKPLFYPRFFSHLTAHSLLRISFILRVSFLSPSPLSCIIYKGIRTYGTILPASVWTNTSYPAKIPQAPFQTESRFLLHTPLHIHPCTCIYQSVHRFHSPACCPVSFLFAALISVPSSVHQVLFFFFIVRAWGQANKHGSIALAGACRLIYNRSGRQICWCWKHTMKFSSFHLFFYFSSSIILFLGIPMLWALAVLY